MISLAKDPDFWEKVKTGEEYRPLLEDLAQKYENYCHGPIQALPFSEYELYYTTGSRKEYERKYFARRARLNTFALLWLIYRKPDYLEGLEDIIWAICDEVSWEVPAHLPNDYAESGEKLALFSCETGFALSEILYLMGDSLHPIVRDRAEEEIKRRIIDVYLQYPQHWEEKTMNWSAVCAGSVGAAFLYRSPEQMGVVLPRILHSMDCFLSGFGEDGACREGLGYWSYGFGFFVYFADLLKTFTDSKIDLFQQEIVRKVAGFQHKVFLQGNTVVSFSDGSLTSKCIFGLTNYLQKRFPEDVYMPDVEGIYDDDCFRWAAFLRNFIWLDPKEMNQHEQGLSSYYFPQAQWKIIKGSKLSFAAKGGNNDEPHNHNDIGSFIIAYRGRQVFCDLGAGEYTKDYFQWDARYGYLVNSSRGHSVPIINGQYQKTGVKYAATVLEKTENTFELELSGAYDLPELKSLMRKFEFEDEKITITDRYKFLSKPKSVIHRLICVEPPVLEENRVLVDGLEVAFDPKKLSCLISKETYKDHEAKDATCYEIDFTPLSLQEDMELKIIIKVTQ
jgi:hypothetical protein